MKKKIISFALSLILILCTLPTTVFATGTAEPIGDTITVNSTETWKAFCEGGAANANATVNITADFFSKGYQFTEEFTGTINGNGHTVTFGSEESAATGDYKASEANGYAKNSYNDKYISLALFREFAGTARDMIFGNNATTKDRISVSTNGVDCSSGTLAWKITGNATLINLTNKVHLVSAIGDTAIGGLVGDISGSNISVSVVNCKNLITSGGILLKSTNLKTYCGGFIGKVTGENVNLSFIGCENNGKMSSNQSSGGAVGGFVGCWIPTSGTLTFDRCVNSYDMGATIKTPVAGFLAKGPTSSNENTFDVSFIQCANRADIEGAAAISGNHYHTYVGGFISKTVANSITFNGCVNTGALSIASVTASSKRVLTEDTHVEVAGFAANCDVANGITLTNCYNSGTQSYPTDAAGYDKNNMYELTLSSGAFTGTNTAEYTTTTDCIDLTSGGTLDDVAALSYGTLYNADGTFVWETSELTTTYGARVRTALPTGIRFDTTISKADYKALTDKYETVSFGTVIVPLAYLETAGEFTFEALEELPYQVKYLNVEWKADALLECEYDGNLLTFNGSVVNIAEKNYELQYAARGYARCTDSEGNVTVIYSSYEQSFFNRSVYDVAEMALADPNNGLSSEALSKIQQIYDKVNGN